MKEKTIIIVGGGQAAAMAAARYASKGSPVSCICFPMSDIYLMNAPALEIHVAGRFPAVTAGVTR